MTRIQLKETVKKLPVQPGIYLFTDNRNKPLYIGKALNLKNRVSQYLKTSDTRLNKMLSEAKKIDFIKTDSDIEALILESQYIKEHRPRFNIMLRDDKQYAFVGFTAEEYSKIFITHQPTKNQNFIGPFTDVGALKITLRYLRRIFPYCTCIKPHHNFCLNYHIGRCIGVCCLKKPTTNNLQLTTYRRNIRALKEILNGKRESLIKDLSKKMSAMAEKEDFEKAINLKSKIEKLKKVFENAKIIKEFRSQKTCLDELARILHLTKPPYRIEGYDVSNIQGTNATGSMVTFVNGMPDKNYYRKFNIKTVRGSNDIAMLREIIKRRFNHPEWRFPDLILIDGGKGQLNAARAAISSFQFSNSKQIQNSKFQIPIVALAKSKYEIFSTTMEKPISMVKLPSNVQILLKTSTLKPTDSR